MAPVVSIILPTYNRAQLIGRAVSSVLSQTFHDFELIIVDDASTDDTEGTMKNIPDHRLRYIKHNTNRGGAAARNTGINAAAGDFIAFQDSDDQWLPDKLSRQLQVFHASGPETGLVYTGCQREDGWNKIYIPSPDIGRKSGNLHRDLLAQNFITLPSVIIKKECFNKTGLFDELLPRLQDWELFIRISKYYEFVFIDEPLVVSYFTPESISSNEDNLFKACEIILDKHHDDLMNYKKILSSHQYILGDRFLKIGKRQKGISFLWESFKNNPRPGLLLAVVVALFGKNAYDNYSSFIQKFLAGEVSSKSMGRRS